MVDGPPRHERDRISCRDGRNLLLFRLGPHHGNTVKPLMRKAGSTQPASCSSDS